MAIVGLGVIIQNKEGKILFGKRKNIHSPYYSIPGGKLDDGETFEEGAKREILEETGLILNDVKVVGLTNNLETFKKDNLHSVSIVLFCDDFSGEPKLLEPHKCEGWQWFDKNNLPTPQADFSKMSIEDWLNKRFYHKYF
jgi:ADP-ribose pyrophosphatase YjhB (NUDIX family)